MPVQTREMQSSISLRTYRINVKGWISDQLKRLGNLAVFDGLVQCKYFGVNFLWFFFTHQVVIFFLSVAILNFNIAIFRG
mmetsp:Transcript_1948/g.5134  ORF Transcript_1948/g.5134 Transcript_1948/m.5134 type:complete len:80 (-) Transcript_1948:9-248(-)